MAACSSVKENKNVFVQPDYTETDAQNVEIGRIQELIRTDSLAALWRCILLEQNTQEIPRIRQQCIDSVLADYNRYIEERDYASARKVLVSLDAAGISAGTAAKTSMELGELMTAAVPPLAEKNIGTAYDGKVSSLIRGTVTIWVDKGLKIEAAQEQIRNNRENVSRRHDAIRRLEDIRLRLTDLLHALSSRQQ